MLPAVSSPVSSVVSRNARPITYALDVRTLVDDPARCALALIVALDVSVLVDDPLRKDAPPIDALDVSTLLDDPLSAAISCIDSGLVVRTLVELPLMVTPAAGFAVLVSVDPVPLALAIAPAARGHTSAVGPADPRGFASSGSA